MFLSISDRYYFLIQPKNSAEEKPAGLDALAKPTASIDGTGCEVLTCGTGPTIFNWEDNHSWQVEPQDERFL